MPIGAQGVSRGIPWRAIEHLFPPIFALLAIGGLLLDAGMFFSLALLRPRRATLPIICACHIAFHGAPAHPAACHPTVLQLATPSMPRPPPVACPG